MTPRLPQPTRAPQHPEEDSRLGELFVGMLPDLEAQARSRFRHVACPATRDDHVAEAVALVWRWCLSLHRRGKDPSPLLRPLAVLAARAVRSGRRLCGQERARDVMSPVARRRHHFAVLPLDCPARSLSGHPAGRRGRDLLEERLHDNTITPPPDQAAFRIDWPHFLGGLGERDRALAEYLGLGHTCTQAADTFGISPGRVSQLRKVWGRRWKEGQGEAVSV